MFCEYDALFSLSTINLCLLTFLCRSWWRSLMKHKWVPQKVSWALEDHPLCRRSLFWECGLMENKLQPLLGHQLLLLTAPAHARQAEARAELNLGTECNVLFWGLVQEPTYRLNMQFSWQLFEDNWWFCRINKRQRTTNTMNKPISHTCKPLSITQCHFPTGLTRSLDLHCTKRATWSTDKRQTQWKRTRSSPTYVNSFPSHGHFL